MSRATFATPINDRYFEDYEPGLVYEFGPIAMEESELLDFARRYDPQSIHIDPQSAAQGPFGGIIASGWHTIGLLMSLYVQHYLTAVASLASPGVDNLRWLKPVRPGDQLTLRVTVVGKRVSRSKPDRGLLFSLMEGLNQHGEVVVSMDAMNMLALRHPA